MFDAFYRQVVTIITLLIGLLNSACGGYCVYAYSAEIKTDESGSKDTHLKFNLPHFFLSGYLFFFGLMMAACGFKKIRVCPDSDAPVCTHPHHT